MLKLNLSTNLSANFSTLYLNATPYKENKPQISVPYL